MEEKTRGLVFKTFRILLIIAAMLVCLGLGANDVANSISPLVIVLQANEYVGANLAYAVGSAGLALGLILLGKKVMDTVGKKVVKLDFAKGFCAQLAAGMSVIAGTMAGMPVSTTHCAVGAVFGIGLANKLQIVKDAYPEETKETSEPAPLLIDIKTGEKDINKNVD
jgi:inorganic phosphate transporter, PiT family